MMEGRMVEEGVEEEEEEEEERPWSDRGNRGRKARLNNRWIWPKAVLVEVEEDPEEEAA